MRCFFRIWDILGRRTGGTRGPVVLEHTSGAYLGIGAKLASEATDALVFPSAAEAFDVLDRFACEPDQFNAVAAPEELSNVA
jgi:hypothetical protein